MYIVARALLLWGSVYVPVCTCLQAILGRRVYVCVCVHTQIKTLKLQLDHLRTHRDTATRLQDEIERAQDEIHRHEEDSKRLEEQVQVGSLDVLTASWRFSVVHT